MLADGRTSVRIDGEVLTIIRRIAEYENKTLNAEIAYMLQEAVGLVNANPMIVFTGTEFLWINPFGNYDKLRKNTWNRFVAGRGLPLTEGERWDESWDNLIETCDALGERVCSYTTKGLVVHDYDLFIRAAKQYE